MRLDVTKSELKILRKAIRREIEIFSGEDVIPSYKAQLTKLRTKLWMAEFQKEGEN